MLLTRSLTTMEYYSICCIITLALVVKPTMLTCTTNPNSAVIVALLPLHSGNNCSTVELRGLQQAAALQAVLDTARTDIKKENNILLNIKFQDTCSTVDGAIKAALKSMVDSDQTCLHPPFFMGFIGPESEEILDAVYQITKLFNATHVTPYKAAVPIQTDGPNSLIHVTTRPTQSQAQSIITILHKMEWTRFSLAVDNSLENQHLAKALINIVQKDSSLCIDENVARITDDASIQVALTGSVAHGVVILADSPQLVAHVLQLNREISAPIVVFVHKVGLQTWEIPSTNSTLVILQETMAQQMDGINESVNTSMYNVYKKQQALLREIHCKESEDINCNQNTDQNALQKSVDASVLPIGYAVRLMASALSILHKTKCRMAGLCSQISRTTSEEWQSVLQKSTSLVRATQSTKLPNKIRFQMDITSATDIFTRNPITSSLEKIGQINNGNKLKLLSGHLFSEYLTKTMKADSANCPDKEHMPTMWSLPDEEKTAHEETGPVEVPLEDEFFGMVMLLCGAGVGILVFFVLVTYVVYSNFKVKNEKESSGGSPSVQRKPSRIARWRRGSGQSSRASIRTID